MHAATQRFSSGSFTGSFAHWVGGLLSRIQGQDYRSDRHSVPQTVEFTHALIALAAKLVAADGKPSTAEYAAFCSVFPLAEGAEAKRRSLFIRAMNDTAPALQYARRIVALYPNAMTLYHELLDRLLQVASADAALNAAEHELLRAVANVFDVPMDQWRHMVGRYIRMADANPYTVLGAHKRMSDSELRARYMAQVRLLHPDRYHAAGASADTIAMLSEKLAAINAAYAAITEARASKGNNKEASAG